MESKKDTPPNRKRALARDTRHIAPESLSRAHAPRTAQSGMADKTYVVRCKGFLPKAVVAASFQMGDEQLLLFDAAGNLAALFLAELIESWSILPH